MTDRAAFIAAIKAAPDDDAPRLVYADWLDENGEEERAEFIRVQVASGVHGIFALTTSNYYGDDFHEGPRYPVIWGADPKPYELAGMATRFRHWCLFSADARIQYGRGFVEVITCPWLDWRDHGDAILAEHPVWKVALTTMPPLGEVGVQVFRATAEYHFINGRWPGIRFDVPNFSRDYGTLRATVTPVDSEQGRMAGAAVAMRLDGMMDRVVRQVAINTGVPEDRVRTMLFDPDSPSTSAPPA